MIDQNQFEELLYSVLNDSANILMRDVLGPQQLLRTESERGGWSDQLCAEYLPVISKAFPLKGLNIVRGHDKTDSAWLLLSSQEVSDVVLVFLDWFLSESVSRRVVYSSATSTVQESALVEVAGRVGALWHRTGL
tara:strand:- start:21017 stop:21421 length:405 start_codon:yes stop_codon:yes gene_type:complete